MLAGITLVNLKENPMWFLIHVWRKTTDMKFNVAVNAENYTEATDKADRVVKQALAARWPHLELSDFNWVVHFSLLTATKDFILVV